MHRGFEGREGEDWCAISNPFWANSAVAFFCLQNSNKAAGSNGAYVIVILIYDQIAWGIIGNKYIRGHFECE